MDGTVDSSSVPGTDPGTKANLDSQVNDIVNKLSVPGTDLGKKPELDMSNANQVAPTDPKYGQIPTEIPTSPEVEQTTHKHLPEDPEAGQAIPAKKDEAIKTPNVKLWDLKIRLNKIELGESGTLLVTREMLDNLSTPGASGYDSDFPIKEDLPKNQKKC